MFIVIVIPIQITFFNLQNSGTRFFHFHGRYAPLMSGRRAERLKTQGFFNQLKSTSSLVKK